jgi:hypothetical protein
MHSQPKLDKDLQRVSAEKDNRGGRSAHQPAPTMTTEILPAPQTRPESAHNLGYTMVEKQVEYDETIWDARDVQREKRLGAKLKRQAKQLGYLFSGYAWTE